MLNFDGDFDGHGGGDVICKHTFTVPTVFNREVDEHACCHGRTTQGLPGTKGGDGGAAGKSGNGGRFQCSNTYVTVHPYVTFLHPYGC